MRWEQLVRRFAKIMALLGDIFGFFGSTANLLNNTDIDIDIDIDIDSDNALRDALSLQVMSKPNQIHSNTKCHK